MVINESDLAATHEPTALHCEAVFSKILRQFVEDNPDLTPNQLVVLKRWQALVNGEPIPVSAFDDIFDTAPDRWLGFAQLLDTITTSSLAPHLERTLTDEGNFYRFIIDELPN